MIGRLWLLAHGQVRVRVTGASLPRFLNLCARHSLRPLRRGTHPVQLRYGRGQADRGAGTNENIPGASVTGGLPVRRCEWTMNTQREEYDATDA